MKEFVIFKTVNLKVEDLSQFQIPTKKCLVYVWLGNRVLGHFFFKPKADENIRIGFLAKLTFALTKTIETELELNSVGIDKINWKTLILSEDFNDFLFFLNKLFPCKIETNERLSVIVCTNENVEGLRNCLAALKHNITEKDEIIVVDYSKEHKYAELMLKNYPEITYIKEDKLRLGKARNAGIKFAKNSIVAFTVDEVMVSKIWADEIKSSFLNKNVMAVSGLLIPVEINSATEHLFNRYWAYNRGYSELTFDYTHFNKHVENKEPFCGIAVSGNMAFRKSIFEKVSLFDEDMENEIIDEVMVYNILSKGWECVYQPTVYVYEQATVTSKKIKKQFFDHMKAQTFWLLQNKRCNPICKNLPFHYYRISKYYNQRGRLEPIPGIKAEIWGILAGIFANYAFRLNRIGKNNKEIIYNNNIPQFIAK